ncbi:MAG: hypothetical protein JWO50_865, partial [Candidatus Kaiserbacteria bacterium]|nr:hypothetical protein [Candidatus Kaiserbacteria bacterium]
HAAIAFDNAKLQKAAQDEIAQRRRAEETQQLLLHEIQHRVKNTLGTVQAIASQTFRSAPAEELRAFSARIQALASAHDLLVRRHWESAALSAIVHHALEPFQDPAHRRFHGEGPEGELTANNALLLAMALHELGTNAVKYGALSNDTGTVCVTWQVTKAQDGQPKMVLEWREQGGPKVTPPTRRGFGSTLIGRGLGTGQGHAEIEFPPQGVQCTITFPLRHGSTPSDT